MMRSPVVALMLACFASVAHAEKTYDSYQAFFDDQSGQVFQLPFSKGYLRATFDAEGEATSSWVGLAGKQRVELLVNEHAVHLNGKTYRLSDAVRLPGDTRSDVDPKSVTLYVNPKGEVPGPLLCIESAGVGSGLADRYSQVYVVERAQGRIYLLKLGSLFGSCRSLVRSGSVMQFPVFSYRLGPDHDTRTGADIQYFAIEGRSYVATEKHLKTRFVQADNVFQFELK